MTEQESGGYERIYRVVRAIPRGCVATYGQIACYVDPPCTAREVGWAMAALRDRPGPHPVPWHRVLNARGGTSVGPEQLERLAAEGVRVGTNGRVDLETVGWDGSGWLDR
jgi:methylated-DNA-protein-cysteine methyltransferase-like protein